VLESASLYDQIRLTRPAAKHTGHKTESPDDSCVIVLFLSSLFWCSNVMYTQSANSRSGCVCGRISPSLKKQMFRRQSSSVWRCLDWETFRYLHDQKAKNMPRPVSWMIAWSSLEILKREASGRFNDLGLQLLSPAEESDSWHQ
jgi:hypothetical protein